MQHYQYLHPFAHISVPKAEYVDGPCIRCAMLAVGRLIKESLGRKYNKNSFKDLVTIELVQWCQSLVRYIFGVQILLPRPSKHFLSSKKSCYALDAQTIIRWRLL